MLESPLINQLIKLALLEDLSAGDITSYLTLDKNQQGKANIVAKQEMVFCGGDLVSRIIRTYRSNVKSNVLIAEGEKLETGQTIASLKGNVIDLLALERTILNFLQRLSGIATHTAELVKKANPLVLLDTRKTTPGWRILEKYAVKIGGAKNHRMNLGDLILIKDNHIDASGGVKQVLEKVYKDKPPYMPVEIEIRNTDELIQALEFKPDIIMLDNMTYSEIKKSISLCIETSPNTQIEISGGVNEESFEDLRNAGVKLASLSALISKASTVDISMKISN